MSRSQNQTKHEPFPASPSESEAETPGADDPQVSSDTDPGRALPSHESAAPGTSEELEPVQGIHTPEVTG
jgi:hypothetical protein